MISRENLLVELLVEELPPKALENLGNAFGRILAQELHSQGLVADASAHTAFASPRRLAVHVRDVATVAPDVPESKKLMPVKVAFDTQGKPSVALTKKAQAMGPRCAALLQTWPDGQDGADRLFVQRCTHETIRLQPSSPTAAGPCRTRRSSRASTASGCTWTGRSGCSRPRRRSCAT